ncbi:MAG: PAS domain S-box protein [Candidatus Schekmanbacteria bacterium]|nr:PAS domain S-box protein [Candidatus Schekmanbacteria bacterium]
MTKKWIKLKLLHKAILAVLVIIIPIIVIYFITYYTNKKYIKNQILDNVSMLAEAYETQVYQFMQRVKSRVERFSDDNSIIAEFDKISNGKPADSAILNKYLSKNDIDAERTIKAIDFISLDGRIVASSDSADIGKDVTEKSFFNKIKTGSNSVCTYEKSNRYELIAAVPVINKTNGRQVGVIANRIDLNVLNSLLSGALSKDLGAITSEKRMKSMEVYIVNNDKLMLTDSIFVKDAILKQRVDTIPVEQALKFGKEFTGFYKDYRGVEVAGSAMLLPSMKWVLLVEIDAEEILKPVLALRHAAIVSGSIVSGLVIALLFIFYRFMVVPLKRISMAAESLTQGNYDVTIPVKTSDEIGELSSSFNKMTSEINKRTTLLTESEVRLNAIIDNTTAAIYMKDINGKYLLANRKIEKLYKHSKEEIIGKSDYDFFPENIAVKLIENDRRVLEVNSPIEFEETIQEDDGLHNYISIKVPVCSTSGTPYGVCGISTDITNLKKTEESLKEAQRISKIGNWEWNSETDIIACSEEVYSIFNLSPHEAEFTYDLFTRYMHPDDVEHVHDTIGDSLTKTNTYSIDYRIVLPDGTLKYINRQAEATFDRDRNPIRIAGTIQDITERKRAEQIQIELQKKYEDLINNLPVGICRILDGYFSEANPFLVKMLEAGSKEELLKHRKGDFILVNKEQQKSMDSNFKKNGLINCEEVELMTLKGKKFWASFSAIARKNIEGGTYVDCIIQNISERKQLEDQLRHSQKMEAIGRLSGGIAHDFNNVLTAIIGYADLLSRKRREDELTKSYTELILNLCQKAASLINGLLAFSRKQIISLETVSLNEIVKSNEKFLRRIIGEDVELVFESNKNDLFIDADRNQIWQILMNFSTNSRDAMPEGGSITIKTGYTELDGSFMRSRGNGKPGEYAFLCFADTGAGIDEENQQNIFDPFFTTKEVGKGTGLGLSIVYGIVKQHNGFIEVNSLPGRGTTFTIYFPLSNHINGNGVIKPAEEPLKKGTETILLAEDDEEVRNMTKTVLEEAGYRVIPAVNGEDAVEKFRNNKEQIQFVILDVIMPKKNGKEALDEIRKITPKVKVLFLSGYTSDILERKGIDEEKLNFISKPLKPFLLYERVRELIDSP